MLFSFDAGANYEERNKDLNFPFRKSMSLVTCSLLFFYIFYTLIMIGDFLGSYFFSYVDISRLCVFHKTLFRNLLPKDN